MASSVMQHASLRPLVLASAVLPPLVLASATLGSTIYARRRAVVAFASHPSLGITAPPRKPGQLKKHGSYCFRATCTIHDDAGAPRGCPVAKIKGYDKSPQIGKDTEEVCRVHVRTMDGASTLRCGEAEVVMLPHSDMECSGQMVFVQGGNVKRLL